MITAAVSTPSLITEGIYHLYVLAVHLDVRLPLLSVCLRLPAVCLSVRLPLLCERMKRTTTDNEKRECLWCYI